MSGAAARGGANIDYNFAICALIATIHTRTDNVAPNPSRQPE